MKFTLLFAALPSLASSPGHSQILSRSGGEKSGESLGSKLCHGPEKVLGGLAYYVMWTRFRNDGNVPTHNAASY